MIIIIEGPDGSGKSILAEELAKRTGYSLVHMTPPTSEEDSEEMEAAYAQMLHGNKIFDRCWYSEMVYGPVLRDGSKISYPAMFRLEKLARKNGAIIIYATGKKKDLWRRCQARGEYLVTSTEAFDSIYDGFEELMDAPHLIPVVRYEYKEV